MSDRVCLIEDDRTIGRLVTEKLQRHCFEASLFESADSLLEGAWEDFDLYIVDRLLPGKVSGLELCERLRRKSATVPILILSALSEPSHRVEGLRQGADDYLTKPFEMEELVLRVAGMLRRRSWYGSLPQQGAEYHWSDCSVDFLRLIGRRGGKEFALTQKEGMLLKLLVENEGKAVSRDTILEKVWGYHLFPSTRTVDNFILRLRKYFEKEPASPKHLLSVRGLGYRFNP